MTNDEQARYTTHPYLSARWDLLGKKLAFTAETVEDGQAWRVETSAKLRELTGYNTMRKAPLQPRVTEVVDCGDYIRQHVVIQTEPGVYMPMYVLIPKGNQAYYPVVIATHGHGSGGKLALADMKDNLEIEQSIAKYNYTYGLDFVRSGHITFCPDARGFGERQEKLCQGDILRSSCREINNMAYPLGQTITGMWMWDIHRLLDYIGEREDCNSERIGCVGLSGGGMQALWAAALDERIHCAIISGYMYGYKEALMDVSSHCSCNYVPHLYEFVDMGDIAAMIAPRPLFIETGSADKLNGISGVENVLPQIAAINKAYRLVGKENLLEHEIFTGGHRWHGVNSVPWMKEMLKA